MASLLKWNEWLTIRESNARKRAVNASVKGLGPNMPGSSAACPSTIPAAMKQAKKRGFVGLHSEATKTPNYSLDAWISKAQKVGKEVKDVLDQAEKSANEIEKKSKDAKSEIDKEIKSKKSKKIESPDKSEKNTESKEKNKSDKNSHEDLWKKFNQKKETENHTKKSSEASTSQSKKSG